MSRAILKAARDNGLSTIVASDRDVLADRFYTARNEDIRLFALPPKGRAPHHYALKFPYQPADEDVLFVTRAPDQPTCPETRRALPPIAPETGAFRKHPQALYVVRGTCFATD